MLNVSILLCVHHNYVRDLISNASGLLVGC
jgi:hypothetical protein